MRTIADTGPLMPTYPEPAVTFVSGEGSWLVDTDGKRYLDFLCGLAVTGLGHAHPHVAQAVATQASTLCHVSNLFGNELAPRLASKLDGLLGGGGKSFLANSGAEANECAIKVARRWGGRGRHVVVSALGSFHGRTLATLHATGQPAKHEVFQPLPEGFRHAEWMSVEALEAAIDPSVAAVFLEPVQGEGGVNPATPEYFHAVRELCDDRGILMMVDEIQTGLGRTGAWFAHQALGVRPDVVTMAKALGNGMPVGACWALDHVADTFEPGDHGSTFGGQPLAVSAALATLEVMESEALPVRAEQAGRALTEALGKIPAVVNVRGMGLLIGAELVPGLDAKVVAARCLEAGLVVNAVTPTALRLAPPLNVSDDEIEQAVALLADVFDAMGEPE